MGAGDAAADPAQAGGCCNAEGWHCRRCGHGQLPVLPSQPAAPRPQRPVPTQAGTPRLCCPPPLAEKPGHAGHRGAAELRASAAPASVPAACIPPAAPQGPGRARGTSWVPRRGPDRPLTLPTLFAFAVTLPLNVQTPVWRPRGALSGGGAPIPSSGVPGKVLGASASPGEAVSGRQVALPPGLLAAQAPAPLLQAMGTAQQGQEGLRSIPARVLRLQRALCHGGMVAKSRQGEDWSSGQAGVPVPIPVPILPRGRRFSSGNEFLVKASREGESHAGSWNRSKRGGPRHQSQAQTDTTHGISPVQTPPATAASRHGAAAQPRWCRPSRGHWEPSFAGARELGTGR